MSVQFSAGCPRLIVFDFDKTSANSFAGATPDILGVEEASRQAIAAIFGQRGSVALEAIGGPGNRSPRELMRALLGAGDRMLLGGSALGYLGRHPELRICMPRGKGFPLPSTSVASLDVITEIFVCAKLLILEPQVSKMWPLPYDGYFDCLALLRSEDIGHGILSAGHENFINRFFAVHDVSPPPMVTDDDLRGGPLSEATKPDVRIFNLFLERHGGLSRLRHEQILYVGDDEERDGFMARDAGAQFAWFNPTGKALKVPLWDGAFEFSHYDELKRGIEDAILLDRAR